MLAFVIRRLLQSILVMLAVALIAFLMFRYVGDPVNQMVGIETSPEEREALRERLGLNDPIFVQFGRYVWNVCCNNRYLQATEQRIASIAPIALLSPW
ncbi:MAG: hypothetical protein AAFR23_05210 [Pseudomonadota bacterium]